MACRIARHNRNIEELMSIIEGFTNPFTEERTVQHYNKGSHARLHYTRSNNWAWQAHAWLKNSSLNVWLVEKLISRLQWKRSNWRHGELLPRRWSLQHDAKLWSRKKTGLYLQECWWSQNPYLKLTWERRLASFLLSREHCLLQMALPLYCTVHPKVAWCDSLRETAHKQPSSYFTRCSNSGLGRCCN